MAERRLSVRAVQRTQAQAQEAMAFPGAEWERIDPEAAGLRGEELEKAVRHLERRTGSNGVSELVVARHGRIVWQGEAAARRHDVWSCTKVFTSTVLGLLIDAGQCSLDTSAQDFLPELRFLYPEITLRHFASMTSGYDGGGEQSAAPFTPTQPLFAPGSEFRYWDAALNQLLHLLTRIAGEPAEDLFRRAVAEPIGMDAQGWQWGDFGAPDGLRINGGAGNKGKGVRISALEMARLGHLFLNGGLWNERCLLSRRWIEAATTVQVSVALPARDERSSDGPGRYGFGWWRNGVDRRGRRLWPSAPAGTYAARGFNNNRCFVIPEWNMVIVRLGQDGNVSEEVYDAFFRRLGKSLSPGKRSLDHPFFRQIFRRES